jgi:hypothetical protein
MSDQRQTWAREQQRRLAAAKVITRMSRGANLQLVFTKTGSAFVLSDGTRVTPEIAVMVINDVRIISGADGLFPSLPQTWKYEEPRSF